jgi:hypothetical protein
VLIRKSKLRWQEGMNAWEVIDFFVRHLLLGYSVSYCLEYVTGISHSSRSDRVTHLFDHYEPARMALFFNSIKWRAKAYDKLDSGVESALDFHILGALNRAYGTHGEVSSLLRNIQCDTRRFPRYAWYRRLGVSGFCRVLGLERGLKAFHGLRKIVRK